MGHLIYCISNFLFRRLSCLATKYGDELISAMIESWPLMKHHRIVSLQVRILNRKGIGE